MKKVTYRLDWIWRRAWRKRRAWRRDRLRFCELLSGAPPSRIPADPGSIPSSPIFVGFRSDHLLLLLLCCSQINLVRLGDSNREGRLRIRSWSIWTRWNYEFTILVEWCWYWAWALFSFGFYLGFISLSVFSLGIKTDGQIKFFFSNPKLFTQSNSDVGFRRSF